MILALREAQPAIPQTVHINNVKLPKMTEGEDVEIFIELFEAAMTDGNIPQDRWKSRLHAALDTTSKLKVQDIITDYDSTYDQVKNALIRCGTLTFGASSEAIMTAYRGQTLDLPIRQAIDKTARLVEKIVAEATTIKEACQYVAIAINRHSLTPQLKYVDLKGAFSKDEFCRTVEEWQSTQPQGTKWSRRSTPYDKPLQEQERLTDWDPASIVGRQDITQENVETSGEVTETHNLPKHLLSKQNKVQPTAQQVRNP